MVGGDLIIDLNLSDFDDLIDPTHESYGILDRTIQTNPKECFLPIGSAAPLC